jgi:hypothetical protein
MPNFLKRLNWVVISLGVGIAALALVVHHEQNDPVRKAGWAKCEAFCGEHPVKNMIATESGTFQCDCEAYTRGVVR